MRIEGYETEPIVDCNNSILKEIYQWRLIKEYIESRNEEMRRKRENKKLWKLYS